MIGGILSTECRAITPFELRRHDVHPTLAIGDFELSFKMRSAFPDPPEERIEFSHTHSCSKKSLHHPFVAMAQRSNVVTNVVSRQSGCFLYFLCCNARVMCSQSKIVW